MLAAHIVAGTVGSIDEEQRSITLPLTGTDDIVPQVVRALDDAGVVVRDVVVRRPTLDDVFLELTGHGVDDELTEAPLVSEPADTVAAADKGAA